MDVPLVFMMSYKVCSKSIRAGVIIRKLQNLSVRYSGQSPTGAAYFIQRCFHWRKHSWTSSFEMAIRCLVEFSWILSTSWNLVPYKWHLIFDEEKVARGRIWEIRLLSNLGIVVLNPNLLIGDIRWWNLCCIVRGPHSPHTPPKHCYKQRKQQKMLYLSVDVWQISMSIWAKRLHSVYFGSGFFTLLCY